ncbi:hypothetical protein [Vulcanococcus limneticus]|uniref:hypothetical protein n=1 Tax=Vulcanococcus limneticus TaxID=2170428 RepID=UPI00398BE5EC
MASSMPQLVSAEGADWPDAICATTAPGPSPEALTHWLQSPQPAPLWIGYTSPLVLLHQAQNQASLGCPPNLLNQLARWCRHAELCLEAQRSAPQRVRLINTSHLNPSAIAQLLEQPQPALGDPPPSAAKAEDLDPRLLLALSRHSRLLNLYADLEAQVDLLGREPEFRLVFPLPSPSELPEQLLLGWQHEQLQLQLQADHQALRQQLDDAQAAAVDTNQLQQQLSEAREEAELTVVQLHQVQEELEDQFLGQQATKQQLAEAQQCHAALQADHQALRQQLDDAQAAAVDTDQLQLQLSEAREEAELTLVQLHQVQEELEYQFLEQRKANQERETLAQQLKALQHEALLLFLHSTPHRDLDRSRLPELTTLIREALSPSR